MKIGFGYDSHRRHEGRKLILGGVEIPASAGLWGHSDADVLLHAIGDALLGALGARDLGYHFPDTDPQNRGLDSSIIIQKIMNLMETAGWRVGNVDCTVILETPRLAPHIPLMAARIAELLRVESRNVSVKAKTNEGMGWIGQGEGVAAMAVVLLIPGEREN